MCIFWNKIRHHALFSWKKPSFLQIGRINRKAQPTHGIFNFFLSELLGEVATRHVHGQMEALVGWGGATWLFCTCCEMAGEPTHMCYALWQMASQFKTPFSNTAFWDSRAQRRVLINFVNNDFYHSFSIGYCMTKRITHVHTFSQRTNEAPSCNFNFCYISII